MDIESLLGDFPLGKEVSSSVNNEYRRRWPETLKKIEAVLRDH